MKLIVLILSELLLHFDVKKDLTNKRLNQIIVPESILNHYKRLKLPFYKPEFFSPCFMILYPEDRS